MKDEWREYRIGEVADIIGGSTPSTSDPDNFNGDIPWLTPKDLSGPHDRYISHGERNLSRTGLANCSAQLLPPGSVLLSSRAPVGYVAIAKNPIATNQGFRSLVLKPGFEPEFIYYWLKANVDELERHASGSTFKELNGSALAQITIRLPDQQAQRAIAHILGTLDDKIELNRRMNATLEAIARAIFKSWFVDFDPVHAKARGEQPYGMDAETAALFPASFEDSALGLIPRGWGVGTLGGHVINLDSKRVPMSSAERANRRGAYPYYGAASIIDYVDDFLFDGIHLLVGEDGSVVRKNGLGVTQYVWGQIWVNNHAHVLQGKGSVSTEQLLFYFDFQPVAPYITGAVQPKLSQGRMNQMPFVYAGDDVCRAFYQTVSPYFELLRATTEQNRTLAELRDALLPRLISGEMRVSDLAYNRQGA